MPHGRENQTYAGFVYDPLPLQKIHIPITKLRRHSAEILTEASQPHGKSGQPLLGRLHEEIEQMDFLLSNHTIAIWSLLKAVKVLERRLLLLLRCLNY